MMHFHVTVSQPGYLPMSDNSPQFETIDDAWEDLVTEIRQDYESDLETYEYEEVNRRYDAAFNFIATIPMDPGSVHVPGPTDTHLGMVYSVTTCEDQECPDGED
jgi:hypothetical protein